MDALISLLKSQEGNVRLLIEADREGIRMQVNAGLKNKQADTEESQNMSMKSRAGSKAQTQKSLSSESAMSEGGDMSKWHGEFKLAQDQQEEHNNAEDEETVQGSRASANDAPLAARDSQSDEV